MSALPSWTGTLKQLRLDPASSIGSFSVDFVQLGRAFVAPPAAESTPHPERYYVEQGGSVAIEAENYTGKVSGTGNAAGHIWQESNVVGGYLGSGAMQALPDIRVTTNLQINGPALTYRIYFQTPGTYYVYLRGYGGSNDDSVHVGIDGVAVTTNAGSGLDGFGYSSFTWRNLYNGVPTQINIPAAGMYTFYMWMREDGTLIDRIWLSKTAGAVANGSTVAGPAESILAFPGSTLTSSLVNVAAYKPAVADSWCNSSEPASKAVNNTWTGGLNDKWCSAGASKWLRVDLGDVYPITSFELYHAGAGGESSSLNTKAFNISVSLDGSNWSEVVNVSNNSANISTHQISPQNARYVRLGVSQGEQSGNLYARIFEFMVFADLPLPLPPPEPPASTPTPPASSGTPGSVTYNGTWTKYYFAGASRVAMRTCAGAACEAPTFLLGDHLGSTSLTVDSTGTKTSEMRYSPWGETRYTWTKDMTPGLPSRYTFTGQYSYMDDPTTPAREGFGLMFYNARWYDVQLGRFAQADSIIPLQSQGTQAWDRYAYVNNNPLKFTDPSGHCALGGHWHDPNSPQCKGGGTGSTGSSSSGGGGKKVDAKEVSPSLDDAQGITNSYDDLSSGENCDANGGVLILCLSLTPAQASKLEDDLDIFGDFLDVVGLAEGFLAVLTAAGMKIDSPISKQLIALVAGLTVPEVLLVAAIVGLYSQGISKEMSNLSEMLDESGYTSTGGTLTVTSYVITDVYSVTNTKGETYQSYGILNAGILKATTLFLFGWPIHP